MKKKYLDHKFEYDPVEQKPYRENSKAEMKAIIVGSFICLLILIAAACILFTIVTLLGNEYL